MIYKTFDQFYTETYKFCLDISAKYIKQKEKREDVLSRMYLRLYEDGKWASFERRSILHVIVKNDCLRYKKDETGRGKEKRSFVSYDSLNSHTYSSGTSTDVGEIIINDLQEFLQFETDPVQHIQEAQNKEIINQMMSGLRPKIKAVIKALCLEERTVEEVAKITKSTIQSVPSLKKYFIQRMRDDYPHLKGIV